MRFEIDHSSESILISQQKYAIDLLRERERGKLACKLTSTAIDPNHKQGKANGDIFVNKEIHKRLVGNIIYLAHTRPDIIYVVSVVCLIYADSKRDSFTSDNRVLHYQKGNPGRGILFKRNGGLALEVYTNTDYAGSPIDKRSTSGYCTFLEGNLMT